jgi:hypothetical protein
MMRFAELASNAGTTLTIARINPRTSTRACQMIGGTPSVQWSPIVPSAKSCTIDAENPL